MKTFALIAGMAILAATAYFTGIADFSLRTASAMSAGVAEALQAGAAVVTLAGIGALVIYFIVKGINVLEKK